MCDCAQAEDIIDPSAKTISIFQPCTNHAIEHTNCEEEVFDGGQLANVTRNQSPCGVCQTGSYTSDVCPTSSSSSESSTDSARKYKFVDERELKCKCDDDDEGGEFESNRSCDGDDLDEFDEEAPDVECTLAIIKPDAVINRSGIEYRINEAGFAIQQTRWLQMTSEQVSEFYADSYEKPDFAHVISYMASGPIVVHVLAKKQAIQEWRTLIGPTKVIDARLYFPDSIRARYGRKGQEYKNAVHGSASPEEAEREIHFFFPNFIIEPFPKWKKAENYLWEVVNKVLAEGLSLLFQVGMSVTTQPIGDICTAELKLLDGKKVLLVVVYISPNKTVDEIIKFLHFVLASYSEKILRILHGDYYLLPMIMSGDFNVNFATSEAHFLLEEFHLQMSNNNK